MKTHKEINNRNTVTSFYRTIDSANPDISQIAGASNIYIGNHEDAPKTADFVIEEDIHTKTVEGNSITINDAIEAPIANLEIKGNSSQNTYQGYNHNVNAENIKGISASVSEAYINLNSYDGYNNVVQIIKDVKWMALSTNAMSPSFTEAMVTGNCPVTTMLLLKIEGSANINFYLGEISGGSYYTSLGKYKDIGNGWAWYYCTHNISINPSSRTIRNHVSTSGIDDTHSIYIAKIQTLTSNTPRDFEPYCGGQAAPNPDFSQPILTTGIYNSITHKYDYQLDIHNINLLQKQALSTPSSDNTFWGGISKTTPLTDGWCRVSADNTAGSTTVYANQFIRTTGAFNIKPNTKYTFYFEFRNYEGSGPISHFSFGNTHSTTLSVFTSGFGVDPEYYTTGQSFAKTITTRSDFTGIGLLTRSFLNIPAGVKINIDYRMMILEGEYTLEEIRAYKQPKHQSLLISLEQPLRGLPNGIKDETKLIGNTLETTRRIGHIIFKGTETFWNMSSASQTGAKAFWVWRRDIPNCHSASYDKICNYFQYKKVPWNQVTEPCLCENSGLTPNMILFSGFYDITNISQWTSWLSTHNVELLYELQEPVKETIIITDIKTTNENYNHIDILTGDIESDEILTYQISPNARLFKRQEDGTLKEVFANEN